MNTSRKRDRNNDDYSDNRERKIDINNYKTDKLADIDWQFNEPKPKNESIVYFLILSHGAAMYHNANSPIFTEIPENIEYFNKITYAPLGYGNFMPYRKDYNDKTILESIKNLLAKNATPLVNNELIQILPDIDNLSNWQTKTVKNDSIVSSLSNVQKTLSQLQFKSLMLKSNEFYKSIIYTKPKEYRNDNETIIDKDFSTDQIQNTMNIYIAFEKGGRFQIGEPILKTKKYYDFLKINYPYLSEEHINEKLEMITTSDLLKLANFYNYKNVVMIDYSCSVCRSTEGEKVPRDIIMSNRNEYFAGSIKRKINKTKKHITRKLKKSKKVKKVNKNRKTKNV